MAHNMINWNIVGHSKEITRILEDLSGGNFPQAYLFAGAAQLGKYTLAKRLAATLQCENDNCNACAVCVNIERGYHPETIEMVDDSESLKIETVRDLIVKLSTTTTAKYKILLVQNIERMTIEAANALLKILEEPPSQVIFLLTTSHVEEILPTIISRVRLMKFHPLSVSRIFEYLKEKYPHVNEEKLQAVADFSFGLPGRAIHFIDHEEDLLRAKTLFQKAKTALSMESVADKFHLIAEITKAEDMNDAFLDVILLALRYTMLEQAEMGHLVRLPKTIRSLLLAQDGLRLQKRNVNARLLLEHLMLQT